MNNNQAAAKRRIDELLGGAAPQVNSNFTGQNYLVDNLGNIREAQDTHLKSRGTLTFTIKKAAGSTVTTELDVSLFRRPSRGGVNADVDIEMQEDLYLDLLEECRNTPFLLKSPIMACDKVSQFTKLLTYRNKTLFADEKSSSITPAIYSSAKNYNQNQLDEVPFEFVLDTNTQIDFKLINDAVVTFTFQVYEFKNREESEMYAKQNGWFTKWK